MHNTGLLVRKNEFIFIFLRKHFTELESNIKPILLWWVLPEQVIVRFGYSHSLSTPDPHVVEQTLA